MSAIRENYVSVKLSPQAHQAMVEEARRRYGDENAISWSALIRNLVDEANESNDNLSLPQMQGEI